MPNLTPRNSMALRIGLLVVLLAAVWFVVFRQPAP